MQKIEELKIELSMLYADLQDTQSDINDKEQELKAICDHSKLKKHIVHRKDLYLPEGGLHCPENESYVYYKCLICGEKIIRDEEDPDLEENVVES